MPDTRYPDPDCFDRVLANWDVVEDRVFDAADPYDVDHVHTVHSPEEFRRVTEWYVKTATSQPGTYSPDVCAAAYEAAVQAHISLNALTAYLGD